jgi:hypothetical protein
MLCPSAVPLPVRAPAPVFDGLTRGGITFTRTALPAEGSEKKISPQKEEKKKKTKSCVFFFRPGARNDHRRCSRDEYPELFVFFFFVFFFFFTNAGKGKESRSYGVEQTLRRASGLQNSRSEKHYEDTAEEAQSNQVLGPQAESKTRPPKVSEGIDRHWYDA